MVLALLGSNPATITTDGTEQTLAGFPYTALGFVGGRIDVTNMQAADVIVLRTYYQHKSGGAYILEHAQTLTGVQPDKSYHFPMTENLIGVKVTIQRTGGVDRAYDYVFGVV